MILQHDGWEDRWKEAVLDSALDQEEAEVIERQRQRIAEKRKVNPCENIPADDNVRMGFRGVISGNRRGSSRGHVELQRILIESFKVQKQKGEVKWIKPKSREPEE